MSATALISADDLQDDLNFMGVVRKLIVKTNCSLKPIPKNFELVFDDSFTVDVTKYPDVKPVKEIACPFADSIELSQHRSSIIELFMTKKFKELNMALKKANGVRTIGGGSYINSCIKELHSRIGGADLAKEWNESEYNSEFSECVYGNYLVGQAWKARGGGFVDTVTEEGWTIFKAKRQDALVHFKKAVKMNPSFSPALLSIADFVGSDSSDVEEFRVWINLGLKVEPWNTALVESVFNYLQPRWNGNAALLQNVAEQLKTVDQRKSPAIMALWKYVYALIGLSEYDELTQDEKMAYKKDLFYELKKVHEEKLMPAYPESPGSFSSLLGVAHRFNLKDVFEETYTEGAKKFPRSYMIHFRKAAFLKYYHEGQYENRVKVLKKVVELLPYAGQAWFQLAQIAAEDSKLIDEKMHKFYFQKAKGNMTSEYYSNAVKIHEALFFSEDPSRCKAEELVKIMSIKNSTQFSRLCGAVSKFYYKKGDRFDEKKAWQYFMLPWVYEKHKNKKLTFEQYIKLVAKEEPSSSKEWYDYSMSCGNYYQKKYYPVEGVITGLKKCVELFTKDVELNIRHKAPYYLGRYLRQNKRYGEAVKYYKMSVDAEVDAWNAQETALALMLDAEERKVPLPNAEICNYNRLAADNMIKEKYHISETGGWYRAIIIAAAESQHKYGSPQRAIQYLDELLGVACISEYQQAEVHLQYGHACLKLDKKKEAKEHFQKVLKLTKKKWLKKNANKELKKLKSI